MDDSERSLPVTIRNAAGNDVERLKLMESEQAELNRSLLRLTTHFAQVQFRLKQIVAADSKDKETLLRDLEEFAFQGCPDMTITDTSQLMETMGVEEHESQLEQQKQKQQQLVAQLQMQLEDIDQCTEVAKTHICHIHLLIKRILF
jgi:RNA processing factor Prp31